MKAHVPSFLSRPVKSICSIIPISEIRKPNSVCKFRSCSSGTRNRELSEDAVVNFLERHGHSYRRGTNEWYTVQVCFEEICEGTPTQKLGRNKVGNLHVLGIHRKNGTYHCFRCGAAGSWTKLLKQMGEYGRDRNESTETKSTVASTKEQCAGQSLQHLRQDWLDLNESYTFGLKTCSDAQQWLTGEIGLSPETLEKFSVGAAIFDINGEKRTCVTFPQHRVHEPHDIVRVRACTLRGEARSALDPPVTPDDPPSLFGAGLLAGGAKHVVLANSEAAAMAIFQETGLPAVSVGDGPAALATVTGDVVRALEPAAAVTLWLADDPPGRLATASLAAKLGRGRCRVVWTRGGGATGPRDAAELLAAHRLAGGGGGGGGNLLSEMVDGARWARHEAVVTFADLRAEVRAALSDPAAAAGTPFGEGLAGLNGTLKGHRPGELTIIR